MKTIWQVLQKPAYLILTVVAIVVTVLFTVLAPNFGLIQQVGTIEGWGAAVKLAVNLVLSISTNLTAQSIIITIVLGFLLGLNISLLISKIKQARKFGAATAATSGVGFFVGLLGIGCAACGTALISAIIPFVTIGGAIAFLPFGGIELQVVALGLLVFSVWRLVKDLSTPMVCSIPLAKAE